MKEKAKPKHKEKKEKLPPPRPVYDVQWVYQLLHFDEEDWIPDECDSSRGGGYIDSMTGTWRSGCAPSKLQSKLNDLGQQGWEVVNIVSTFTEPRGNQKIAVLLKKQYGWSHPTYPITRPIP